METDNAAETSGASDADRDDKKEVQEGVVVKTEVIKASSSIPTAPTNQETVLKVENKEEEMIHDSDFEEPSGILLYFESEKVISICFSKVWKVLHFKVVYQLTSYMQMKLLDFQILHRVFLQHKSCSCTLEIVWY